MLVEDELRRRTEELTAAYQSLESFTYSVSHDLRSPLRAIEGFARILLDDFGPKLGEDGREIARVIHDGCRKMDELLTGLLAYSQCASRPLARVHINMTAMAEEVTAELVASAGGAASRDDIKLVQLPSCCGDPVAIRQVWQQLIGNALRFSTQRVRPLIEISGNLGDHECIYHVQDHGVGFDMRYAHKLFAVFQRLHSSEQFPGIGVGLAIAHRILARHAGRIWAEAIPEVGACFHFALPIVTECAAGHTMDAASAI